MSSSKVRALTLAVVAALVVTAAPVAALAAPRLISGTLKYQDTGTPNIKNMAVTVTSSAGGSWTSTTNSSGYFSLYGDTSQLPVNGWVKVSFTPSNFAVDVKKMVSGAPTTKTFAYQKTITTSSGTISMSTTFTTDSALLNIHDMATQSRNLMDLFRGDNDAITQVKVFYPDANIACYEDGVSPTCGVSGGAGTIHIPSAKGFKDGVIIHEYAHHLQKTISRPDTMMGGFSDPCAPNTSWEHAWHEGFPQFYAGLVLNSATWSDGSVTFNLEVPTPGGVGGCPLNNGVYNPNHMEAAWAVLWDVSDGSGTDSADEMSAGWIALPILDYEFDVQPATNTILKYHDALVARNMYVQAHRDIDKIYQKYNVVPGNIHQLGDYYVSGFIPSSSSVAAGDNVTFHVWVANATGFTYSIPWMSGRILDNGVQIGDSFMIEPSASTKYYAVTRPMNNTGYRTVSVEVDFYNSTPENNEGNNVAYTNVSVATACGNGVCGTGEDSCNCPGDCPDDPWSCSACQCGGNGGNCFCDSVCIEYGDCCSNGPC